MTTIRVSTLIDAPPARVWESVRDISSHIRWMDDADAIRFTSATRTGVGTTFDCDTRVGPLRLTDHMEVTEWEEPRRLGIRHVGEKAATTLARHLRTMDEVLKAPVERLQAVPFARPELTADPAFLKA